MNKRNKHFKRKRQQPTPKHKKQKMIAKSSIKGDYTFEAQMRAMGKRLLEVFKDKDCLNNLYLQ